MAWCKVSLAAVLLALAILSCSGGSNGDAASPPGGADGGKDAAAAGDALAARDAADAAALDSGMATPDGSRMDAGPPPPDPCIEAGTCPPGTWINVTPPAIDLVSSLDCGNYGTKTVQVDPLRPSDVYTLFFCQGLWKSTDYGATWTGPINTGMNGSTVGDCAGGITIPPSMPAGSTTPILYASCIRGTPVGFWKSTNGGVDWTNYSVLPDGGQASAVNQQFYPPIVDPYDANHLLMAGHEVDLLVESTDGGMTWRAVPTDPGMSNPGGTGGPEFIDTGDPSSTRETWLWLASQAGGTVGTWRTTNSGAAWTRVDNNEHTNGANGRSIVYQPDTTGVMYMAGVYSALGWGVLRSNDYGATWTNEGANMQEAIVIGTSKSIYSMFGWAIGAGQMVDPSLQVGPQPGTSGWTTPATPAAMTQGPAEGVATSDGTHAVILVANYNAGLWRYVEP